MMFTMFGEGGWEGGNSGLGGRKGWERRRGEEKKERKKGRRGEERRGGRKGKGEEEKEKREREEGRGKKDDVKTVVAQSNRCLRAPTIRYNHVF